MTPKRTNTDHWFYSKSPAAQKAYIAAHPNSVYAKKGPKASGSKKVAAEKHSSAVEKRKAGFAKKRAQLAVIREDAETPVRSKVQKGGPGGPSKRKADDWDTPVVKRVVRKGGPGRMR